MANGKVSKSQKGVSKIEVPEHHKEWADAYLTESNMLSIPAELKRELDEKDFAYRFINATAYAQNHGFRKGHWMPYKPTVELTSSLFGGSPDGYFRRGDLVLAVRPKAIHEQEKAKNKLRAEIKAGQGNKAKVNELKGLLGKYGTVHEDEDLED